MPHIDENEVLRDVLSGLNEEVPPMPENLHAAWMQKVEEDKMEKTTNRRSFTRFLSVAAAMVFVIGGTLLTKDQLNSETVAASDKNATVYNTRNASYQFTTEEAADMDFAMGAAPAENGVMLSMARNTSSAVPAAEAPAATEKKIIRTASLTLVTQDYQHALSTLIAACEGQGGWIEHSSESTNSRTGLRTAYLTLRIPQAQLDVYLAATEDLGRTTNRSESAEDVTASYQDTQTRLDTQLALMERLQALITESGDLSDLLALESQIAETQYQIDSLQTALNRTDRQVSYSTITITLQEEKAPELTDSTVSFGERIRSAIQVGWESFVGFLGDMVVFLMAALPFMAIVAVVAIAARLVFKRRKK